MHRLQSTSNSVAIAVFGDEALFAELPVTSKGFLVNVSIVDKAIELDEKGRERRCVKS